MGTDATDEEFEAAVTKLENLTDDLEAAVKELWAQANGHCVAMNGTYINPDAEPPDDWNWEAGDWNPPMPGTLVETINAVTKYLKDSV